MDFILNISSSCLSINMTALKSPSCIIVVLRVILCFVISNTSNNIINTNRFSILQLYTTIFLFMPTCRFRCCTTSFFNPFFQGCLIATRERSYSVSSLPASATSASSADLSGFSCGATSLFTRAPYAAVSLSSAAPT